MSRTIQRHSSPAVAGVPVLQGASRPADPILNIWQSPTVQNVIPFVTSLCMHLAIICIGMLTYKAITLVAAPREEIPSIIPDSPLICDFSTNAGFDLGTAHDPIKAALQDKILEQTELNGLTSHDGANRMALPAAASQSNDADSIIGPGPESLSHSGPGGRSGDDSGALAIFGVRGRGTGTAGSGSPLFTDRFGGAHKILYVCDASGSMLSKMEPLKVELTKAIMVLKPIQGFNLIFFRDQTPQSFGPALVPANPEGKARAVRFLGDVTCGRETNPIPGIEQAFRQKPEMIYLLTDGDFPDNDAVLARIRLLNRDHKVRIHTIAFVGRSDTDEKFKELLRTVAAENGGTYKCISPDDL